MQIQCALIVYLFYTNCEMHIHSLFIDLFVNESVYVCTNACKGSARAALARAGAPQLAGSTRARWLVARALDQLAEEKKNNNLLERAIQAYIHLIQHHQLSDARLNTVAERVIDRARFRGTPLAAVPAHRALMSRYPRHAHHSNQLVISYLMANRLDMATEELKAALVQWPDDTATLAHYGFVLKMQGNLQEAIQYLEKALSNITSRIPDEAKFHYHLGDALLQLEQREEAHRVHVRAAKLGFFKSPEQRSLYNVDRLRAQPWWDLELTPYRQLKRDLEASWKQILEEGEAARASYEAEKEGLRKSGEWSQLDLISRGREVGGRCARAKTACAVARRGGAGECLRGQTKFSLLSPGSHVRPHTGPTNCRIRIHLALANTDGAYIRVHNETRQWEVGRVLAFDDSFEHEVWHNGTAPRLVLIVDVWHPDLTPQEKLQLTPI